MKNLLTPSRTLATSLLLGAGLSAGAQSLGLPRVEAWVGRPLEINVPARMAPDGREDCIHADVYYGEQRVSASQVRTTLVGTGEQRTVRVETDALIDDPVVTVAVRAGCANTITRKYTLLPEMPSEQVLAAAAARSVQPGGILTTAISNAFRSPAARPAPTQTVGGAPARMPALRPALLTSADTAGGARMRPAQLQRPPAAAGARLRLAALPPEADTLLRSSAQLAEPLGDAARRVTASLLWQALNADPQELLRASAALQKLEGDLAQLRQLSSQNRNEMTALRRELNAPAPVAARGVAQGLALLVLLAGGSAGYLWFRNRKQPGRWSGMPLDAQDSMLPPQEEAAQPAQQPAAPVAPQPAATAFTAAGAAVAAVRPTAPAPRPPAAARPQPVVRAEAPRAEPPRSEPPREQGPQVEAPRLDSPRLDLPAAPAFGVAPSRPARTREPAPLEFDLPEPALAVPERVRAQAPTMLRVETLAATFEEVEFLASLGLGNDAMDVLKTYMEDSGAPAPMAFYQLMRLYADEDDAASLLSVRKRYAQVFGVEAPRFEQINAGSGLEDFPDLVMRITRAWGTAQVLDVLEQALFAVPAPGKAFSLQAGRDLLFLHDVSMVLLTDVSSDHSDDPESHVLAPWADVEDAHSAAMNVADVAGGHRFALDLDLSAMGGDFGEVEARPSGFQPPVPVPVRRPAAPAAPAVEEYDAFSAAVAGESRRGRLQ